MKICRQSTTFPYKAEGFLTKIGKDSPVKVWGETPIGIGTTWKFTPKNWEFININ